MKKYRILLFTAYIFVVIWLTLLGNREFGERRAVLIPFWEMANIIKGKERSFYICQVTGNLALLMPFGFMLPMFKAVNWKKVLLMSLCFSVGIELTQFITGLGLMEFDDVFNNTVGGLIGYMIYKAFRKKFSD